MSYHRMKYLKTILQLENENKSWYGHLPYESNPKTTDFEERINDVLVELRDLSFQVDKNFWINDDMGKPGYEEQCISLRISKKDNSIFLYDEIDEILMTLIDYVEDVWGPIDQNWRVKGLNYSKRLSWNKDKKNKPLGIYVKYFHLSLKQIRKN